jgi:AbrB family looped-hinge helix DNA binding protein
MLATMTSKGQLTIPVEARRKLGLKAGMKVDLVTTEDGRLELIPLNESVKGLKGMVPKPKKPLTLEEMDRAIASGSAS